ncbi:MAG: thymidine phosphorylase [Vicinamibacterales bacterium]
MRAVDIICAKRDGERLDRQALDAFVAGVLDGTWADYQTSALLMAITLRGMTAEETADLTEAMLRSGRVVDLSGLARPTVGKHSTGGVGDKVSIVLAPAVAACGAAMPKMSGRGLGHTGGTLDKLESIAGFRVALSPEEFVRVLGEVGCVIAGQTADIAPVDKVLYALRDVTATVPSVPLIAASVMSKKLAEGSRALVLDVKCGHGAFMTTLDDALALARVLVAIGTAHGVRTEAFVTAMDAPLGAAVGNALEVAEAIEVLAGGGPTDLRLLVETLGARALELAGCADGPAAALDRIRAALDGGAARAALRAMVAAQGGDPLVVDDPARLPQAATVETVPADADGVVAAVDAAAVGRAAVLLGAGRDRAGDPVDHAAGLRLRVRPGDRVARGAPLLDLHYNATTRVADARALAAAAVTLGTPPPAAPIVRAWVCREGERRYA